VAEREENVRIDVFGTFVGLLDQIMNLVPIALEEQE